MFSDEQVILWPFRRLPISVARAARMSLILLFLAAPLAWHCGMLWLQRSRLAQMSLEEAIIAGDASAVKELIARGADPAAQIENDYSPLMVASLSGHCDVIEALLDRGAAPNGSGRSGQTPLSLAAWQGNERAVALLLSRGAGIHPPFPGYHEPPLVAAARGGVASPALVKLLIDAGADIDERADDGTTAPCAARASDRQDLVELLTAARHQRYADAEPSHSPANSAGSLQ